MANPRRKVVAELSKVWESVVAKGKVKGVEKIAGIRTWFTNNQSLTSFQNVVHERIQNISGKLPKDLKHSIASGEVVPEQTKVKIGRLMSAYEELIGISEVKAAHARVLSAEAKFIACQEQRRQSSKDLMEIQNRLTEVRQELDRTQRGDDNYLELIKKEIGATKEERIVRKYFEDLERAEREVFSELSSALRFSHEKERAQNEKTKYWSIVGSIIGAGLGILGTTINNKMKQNHLKGILEETSSQVAGIQATVEKLVATVSQNSPFQAPAPAEIKEVITYLQNLEKMLASYHKDLSKTLKDFVLMTETVVSRKEVSSNVSTQNHLSSQKSTVGGIEEPRHAQTAVGMVVGRTIIAISYAYLLYKFIDANL